MAMVLEPMVNSMIGSTFQMGAGGSNVQISKFGATPENAIVYPSRMARCGERPASRPEMNAPIMTPEIIGTKSQAKPVVVTPSSPIRKAGAAAM